MNEWMNESRHQAHISPSDIIEVNVFMRKEMPSDDYDDDYLNYYSYEYCNGYYYNYY